MYTEESVIDQINARDTGHIEIRTSNRVLKDGAIISTQYHRNCLNPDSDLSAQDSRVAAIARAAWTPEVVAAYRASQTVVPAE